MKIQYIEVYKDGERVYQGVALGEKDAQTQVEKIVLAALEKNQDLVYRTNKSWDIIDIDSRDTWGRVEIRAF